MKRSKRKEAAFFLKPGLPKQRLYEALRAIFVEQLPVKEVAKRFGYNANGLHVQCSRFRAGELGPFFLDSKPGPRTRPKRDPVREWVIELRKKNYSIYDINRLLKEKKHRLSPRSVWQILREAGFARLPRRLEEERPDWPKPEAAAYADRRELNLRPGRVLETQSAGLFLLLPDLVALDLPRHVRKAAYPGTKMIPALQYVLSLLALKLLGRERYSHVMDCCHDPGLGLFAGLNVIPKTTALTTYSYRIARQRNVRFLGSLVRAARSLEGVEGESINLDFHSIPHFGDESVLEKHYVPRRSHAEKSVLVCLAQDGGTRAFCYSNAYVLKKNKADEVLRFAKFWKKATGSYPKELVFDSQFTTIGNLSQLNRLGIRFITLRKKGKKLIADLMQLPKASWERCKLDVPHRKYQTPRYYESRVELKDYTGRLRQLAVTDLGRDLPTILITNHMRSQVKTILTRYAQRMLIENAIADAVHFFHVDALCSSLHMEVDFSVLLTVLANLLYHLLARRIAGFEDATAKQIYRKFIDSSGDIRIGEREILVRMSRRAYNPLLIAADFDKLKVPVPWLKGYTVRYAFK